MAWVPIAAAAVGAILPHILNQFSGDEEGEVENHNTLLPEQRRVLRNTTNAARHRGAGGAAGTAADYYRDILSNNPKRLNEFMAPELTRYYQDIVPNISEQFAGMGSGALSSSGFRNAQVQGGTELTERLANIRANLRNQAAQGLMSVNQAALGQYSQPMQTSAPQPGLGTTAAPYIGQAVGGYINNWVNQQGAGQGGGQQVGQNSPPYGGGGNNIPSVAGPGQVWT